MKILAGKKELSSATLAWLLLPTLISPLMARPCPAQGAQSAGVTDTITMGTARKSGVVSVQFEFKEGPPSYKLVGTLTANVTVNQGANETDKGNAIGAAAREALAHDPDLNGKVDVGNVGAAVSASARSGSEIAIARVKVALDQTNQSIEHGPSGSVPIWPPLTALPQRRGTVLGTVFAFWAHTPGGTCSGLNPLDHSNAAIEIETSTGSARVLTTPGETLNQVYGQLLATFLGKGIPAQLVPGQGLWVPGDWRWCDVQDGAIDFAVRPD